MADDREDQMAFEAAVAVEAKVGHPGHRWGALIERVQRDEVGSFREVEEEFLGLMWCLDRYRIADVPPIGMGRADLPPKSRIDGVYRGKGNWLSTLLGLLLDSRTGQKIRSISKNSRLLTDAPDRPSLAGSGRSADRLR